MFSGFFLPLLAKNLAQLRQGKHENLGGAKAGELNEKEERTLVLRKVVRG